MKDDSKEFFNKIIPEKIKKKKPFQIAFWVVIVLAILILFYKLFTLSSFDVIIGAFIVALVLLWREINTISKEIEDIKSKLKEK